MKKRLVLLSVAVAAFVGILTILWLGRSPAAPSVEHKPAQVKATPQHTPPAPAPPQDLAPLISPLNQPVPEVNTRFTYDPSIPLRREVGEIVRMAQLSGSRNVGRATLAGALESQYWAIAGGNVDYMEQAIVLDRAQSERMAKLLSTAPEKIRKEHPTPERFAAFLLAGASSGVRGFAASRQIPVANDETIISVDTISPGQDRSRGHAENFRRTNQGEWQRVITAKMVTDWENSFGQRAAAPP